MITKEEFTQYLTSLNKYATTTVYTYGQSIDLISSDIITHLESNFKSLFEINDVEILNNYFERLYSIPKIIKDEETQRNRKKNAFKRYIEFCENIEKNNFNINQPILEDVFESRSEGGKKVVVSKIAERDLSLRISAIKIHGTNCFGCGFNFENKYGQIGKRFIEIHHVVALSTYEKSKKIDPYTDLIPLCSNCHRIVHRKRNYVLSLLELRDILM